MELYGFEEHWERIQHNYVHWVRVHELGGGHCEILVTRGDRFSKDVDRSLRFLSEAEREAANVERAARRAKSEVRRRCKLMGLDSMLTLTYRANQTDEELCKRHMAEFIRRIRRVIHDFRYVAAFERQERGAWHVHMAVQRIQSHFLQRGVRVKSFDLVRSIWRSVVGDLGGNIDIQRRKKSARKSVAQLAAYLSKYMTKSYETGESHSKRWTASRFRVPEPSRFLVRDLSLRQIVANVVGKYAPAGTQIRCHLVDGARGMFITVEPTTLLSIP